MAGTVHGLVNRKWDRWDTATYDNTRNIFACFAEFFDHLCTVGGGSIMTRVASQHGNGSGLSRGQVGSNHAWGVWKMNTSTLRPGGGTALGEVYFLLVQMASSYDIGYVISSTTGATQRGSMSMAIAFREDGGNPWNGGTDNDGLDEVGSPVWTAGASTVHVFPRSNNPGGSHNTNKNNVYCLSGGVSPWYYYMDIAYGYFHAFADDDTIAILHTGYEGIRDADDPKVFSAMVFGLGTTQPNITTDPYFCYCWWDEQLPYSENGAYGDTGGGGMNNGGIIRPPGAAPYRVGTYYGEIFLNGLDSSRQPNPYSLGGGTDYDEAGLNLLCEDAWLGYSHEPGGDDFWRLVFGVPNEGYDPVAKRAAFGNLDTLSMRVSVPWPDSIGEAPGATRTLDGVFF